MTRETWLFAISLAWTIAIAGALLAIIVMH